MFLEQARQMFFAHGYHGVSVREIVQACGLSNAALYHHFGSKENLFIEGIQRTSSPGHPATAPGGRGCHFRRQRLTQMTEAYAESCWNRRANCAPRRDVMAFEPDERQRLLIDAQWQIPPSSKPFSTRELRLARSGDLTPIVSASY